MDEVIFKIAQVESVDDFADGLRIKARMQQDHTIGTKDLPYAFPLLPKTIYSVPKVGECVLITTSKIGNNQSNRYYIGPIISQPQFQYKDSYEYGRGSAISLLQGAEVKPLEKISNYSSTNGSFPNINDIAIVGRKSEDVILKDGEIDIRCGIRGKSEGDDKLIGNVIFNQKDPTYIQLKHKNGLVHGDDIEANGIINLVSDKINLISHQDKNYFNLTDQNELIKIEDLPNIMEKLHQVPYGDVLVEVLNKIITAVVTHVHSYPGLPPVQDFSIMDLTSVDLDKINSTNVRIS